MTVNGQPFRLARGADTGGNKFYIYNGALANLREAQDEVVAITLNGAIWEFVIVTQEARSSQTADVEIPAAKWIRRRTQVAERALLNGDDESRDCWRRANNGAGRSCRVWPFAITALLSRGDILCEIRR